MPVAEVGILEPSRGWLMSAQSGSGGGPVRPEDLDVTLAVRRELGAENEQAVIAEFLDRIGSSIDARVDARVAARMAAPPRPKPDQGPSIALGIVSIIAGIPITAIALSVTDNAVAGVIVMIVAWLAIAAVNVAYVRRT